MKRRKKEIIAAYSEHQEWIKLIEARIRQAMSTYDAEQRRKAAQEQARLDREARREQERLQARAEKAAEKGQLEKASVLSAQANVTTAPVANTAAPKVAGLGNRKAWDVQVTDKVA